MTESFKLERTTFRHELRRAVASGFLEAATGTFLLLVAVRWYEVGSTGKALVAAAGQVGFLLAPMLLRFARWRRWTPSGTASFLFSVGGGGYFAIAMVPSPTLFVVGSVVAAASAGSAVPLLTQMYRENYPDKTRGTLFSRTVIVRILSAVAVSEIAGRVLTYDLALFRALLLSFSGASLFAAFCLYRCPTLPLKPDSSPRWFNGARCIVDDSLFRNTLIAWMLMGFGNLMMNPLRVEYLADPKYGLSLTVSQIAFLNSVLPNLIRVVLTPFWGRLFDKADFFVVRMVLNLGYLSAILSFFTSTSNAGLVVGALIFGAANAGGEIAWSLWVTKLAPPGKTADYMAVHIFLTGLRGVAAPFAAFYAVTVWPLHTLAVGAALLIFAATLMILAEWAKGSRLVAPQERVVTSL